MARWFIISGIILVMVGLVLHFAPGVLHWFGRLPGDIRIENEHSKVFIPVTSMVLVSLAVTIVLNLIRWLLK